jgi:uroporphyrinogen decarboxylase
MEVCLSGAQPDRVPVALWRHFPVDDQTPEGLAQAALQFQRTFDFDLVKLTPESSFCLKDWGARDEWRGATEGTRDYTHRIIQNPEDWLKLRVLDPYQGHLKAQLDCLKTVCSELGEQTPVLQTIFSPLSQAKNLVGSGQLLVHLRKYPDLLRNGLSVILESTLRFIEAAKKTGIAGIFFAVQHAQYGLLSPQEYLEFGRAFDLEALAATQDLWLNMLHLHGVDVMFELVSDFPVQIINWHDQETPPSLSQARSLFPGVLCGGIQREASMVLGTPQDVAAEAQRAIQVTGGKRFLLGTGCVVPITAPYGNLLAARKSVEK